MRGLTARGGPGPRAKDQKRGSCPGNSGTTYPSKDGCTAPSCADRREPGQDTSSPLSRAPGGSWRAYRPATTAISRRHSGQVLRREDEAMTPVCPPLANGAPPHAPSYGPTHDEGPRDLLFGQVTGPFRSRVAAPGFEPGKAEPADLQRARFSLFHLRVPVEQPPPGDAWGNEPTDGCIDMPSRPPFMCNAARAMSRGTPPGQPRRQPLLPPSVPPLPRGPSRRRG